MEFKYSVAMVVTEEQFNKDLKQPLLEMGFENRTWGIWDDYRYKELWTNKKSKTLGNYFIDISGPYYKIKNYNPELFLALAAMTNNEKGNIGEYWYFFGEQAELFKKGGLYKQIEPEINNSFALLDDNDTQNGFCGQNLQKFRKATVEEIMEKFNKNICFKSDGTKKTGQKIIEELEKLGAINKSKYDGASNIGYYFINSKGNLDMEWGIPEGYELVNLNKENNMEKEIIGYKLIKSEYKEAACKIGATDLNSSLGKNIAEAKNTINKLKEAGVLDLWFEPVYKEEKQDIVLTLSNGKQVTVTKEGKIMAEGNYFNTIELKKLYALMFEPFEHINRLKVTANSINIGCWEKVTKEDLKLILETQEKQTC